MSTIIRTTKKVKTNINQSEIILRKETKLAIKKIDGKDLWVEVEAE